MTKRCLLLSTSLVMGISSPALAQRVGPEFQVNTYTTGGQSYPSIASDASGNFVVVWESEEDGGIPPFGELGVFGQRYDSSGNPLGSEFQVNTFTSYYQRASAVSLAPDGNFVVIWSSNRQDGNNDGVFGQRYDSDGNRLGNEFQVNTHTTERQIGASVASDANGNFVVVWWSGFGDDDVFAQRYDSGGNRLGGEFQVNTYTTGAQTSPDVALDPVGNFVVVWTSDRQDGNADGVFAQRYDSGGNRVGDEFQVNSYTTSNQGGRYGVPAVASDADGDFIVVWASEKQGGDVSPADNEDRQVSRPAQRKYGVFGQRYDSRGNRLGGEFLVNSHTVGDQQRPRVSSDASGAFVVVWHSYEGSSSGIVGQRFDSEGKRIGGEFQVNTYITDSQRYAAVASDTNGNFVVVWQNDNQDGSREGIFGQRFSAECEASLQLHGDVHVPGSAVAVQVHIVHRRSTTVTVPWELRLLDSDGQEVAKRATEPLTFEPGDVLDRTVDFRLPDDLAAGTYTLELAISGMAGTKGASTTLRIIRAE